MARNSHIAAGNLIANLRIKVFFNQQDIESRIKFWITFAERLAFSDPDL